MENNQLAEIIKNQSNVRLFRQESGYPKNNAQMNLAGRTHWSEDSSLHFFGSRINSAHDTSSGLLFYVIESSFTNWEKTKRGFRFHVFDIFGNCVISSPMDMAFKKSEQARKSMYESLNSFNELEHYKEILKNITITKKRELNQIQEILLQLDVEVLTA